MSVVLDAFEAAKRKYENTGAQSAPSTKGNSASVKTSGKTENAKPQNAMEEALAYHASMADEIPMLDLSKKTERADERTWFQKGALEDGVTIGNVAKAAAGTVSDARENVGAGALGIGEKLVDALAWAAPYIAEGQFIQNGGAYLPVAQQQQFRNDIAQQKDYAADFIAKDLYDEEEIAKKLNAGLDPLVHFGVIDPEKDSVLGEKSDALMQSAGQLAAQAGLQMVGVPWFVTSGVSSFGSEVEGALQQGASMEEAGLSGAINAGAEILTEKLFGGDLFVKNAGFDGVVKKITKGIANKFVQKAAQLGLNAVGEGAEEWLSQRIGQFGQWLTYNRNDQDLLQMLYSNESIDEAIEAFLGGTILGGGMGAINAVSTQQPQSNAQGDANAQAESGQVSQETAVKAQPGTLEWALELNELGKGKNTQKNADSEEATVTVSGAGSAINDNSIQNNTLGYKLASNLDAIRDMQPVKDLTGKEFNNREVKLSDQIANFFKSLGNKVMRVGFGDIELGEYGVGGMMNHRPLNRAKMVSLAAVPDVIQNGRQISYEKNWKGRGYDSYIFAAPVMVNGTEVYVAAVVDKRPNNKFYLSEMVDSQGNYVRIEESPSSNSKNGVTDGAGNSGKAGVTARPEGLPEGGNPSTTSAEPTPLFNTSISQTDPGVNTNSDQSAEPSVYDKVMETIAIGQGKDARQQTETTEREATTQQGNNQLNIDNTGTIAYNNTINGGEQNERTASAGADQGGISGVYEGRGTDDGIRAAGNGASVGSGLILLSPSSRNLLSQRGVVNVELHESSADNAAFSAALDNAREADTKNGWAVTPKTKDELDSGNIRTFMDSNASTGFAIAPDGDIEAVFANKAAGAPKGSTRVTIPLAIANGGTKLDCYGIGLVRLYAKYGFIPVARTTFNPEYANDGWTPDKGNPDIYFMMSNGDSADKVVQNYGNYHVPTPAELDALPLMEYDEAYAYRDNLQQEKANTVTQPNENSTESVGAAPAGFDPNTHLQYQYGTLPEGENAVRSDDLPVSTDGTNRVSQTAVTVKGAKVTSDDFADLLTKDVTERNGMTYIPITNDATVQKAIDHITEEGWEVAKAMWHADVRAGKAGADLSATGALLLNNAAKAGDKAAWLDILHDYQLLGTNTAQGLQALRILKQLSPSDKLYMAKRSVKQMVKDMKLDTDVAIDPELETEYNEAQTDEQRDAVLVKIQKNVAQQLPTTFMEKFTALRYVNMLGNLRTQGRNIAGNLTMKGTRTIHNAIAAGIETVANKVSGGKVGRTRSVAVSKAQKAAAAKDFDNLQEYILEGGKYNDNMTATGFARGVQEQKQIFKSRLLEGYRKVTNWAMEQGDLIFAKDAYARALAGYLKANGITETDYSKVDPAIMDDARLFAAKEAQEATFRDTNWLSGWVSKIGRRKDTPAVGKLLSEGIMPFRKTPANVLVRAEEYSPLGVINSVVTSVQKIAGNTKLTERHGLLGNFARAGQNITGTQVINSWAKTLTGTGLFGVGMLLQSLGLLSGGPDDDEDKDGFEDLNGWQNYALTLPDGTNLTIDCFSPSAIPVLMGAQLMNEIRENGFELKDIGAALTSIADPMVEMSMLQGVNDSLENIQYADSNLVQFAINAAVSYLTQGLTNTLAGQLERSFEDSRMQTYVDKDSELPAGLQRTLGKASAKTPGLDYNQIPYINAWGEEEENPSTGLNLVYNLLSPSYFDKGKDDDLTRELNRLNGVQSDVNVYPSAPDKTMQINKQDYNLSAEEYVELAKLQGQTQKQIVEDIMANSYYDSLSDEEKAKAIRYAYDYARDLARGEVVEEHPGITTKWMQSIGDDPAEGIIRHIATDDNYAYLSVSDASYVDKLLADLLPESGKTNVRTIQQVEAIAGSKLSEIDQMAVLEDTLDDKAYAKYLRIIALGVDTDDYAESYRLYLDAEGGKGKKARIIDQFQDELNVSKDVAEKLYDIYAGAK